MEQFIMLDKNVLSNPELSANEKIIYSVICDRMDSSRKRPEFYDNKENDFYVIYTIDELSNFLTLSPTTVTNALSHLTHLGFIDKVKPFGRATRLFLPKYDKPEEVVSEQEENQADNQAQKQDTQEHNIEHIITEIVMPKLQKLLANHTDFNHKDFTVNTDNTENTENRVNEIAIEQKKKSMQRGGFNERTANVMTTLAFNDMDYLDSVIKSFYGAKNAVYELNKSYDNAKLICTLESDYNNDLEQTMKRIMLHAGKKPAQKRASYVFTSVFNHYSELISNDMRKNNAIKQQQASKDNGLGFGLFKIGGNQLAY